MSFFPTICGANRRKSPPLTQAFPRTPPSQFEDFVPLCGY